MAGSASAKRGRGICLYAGCKNLARLLFSTKGPYFFRRNKMEKLAIEMFVTGGSDVESRQYRILRCLKEYYNEFSRNRLYPAFKYLLDVTSTLEELVEKKEDMEGRFPQHLAGVDIEHRQLIYDPAVERNSEFQQAMDLIRWALPQLKKAIDEAINIYHFVDDHIGIEEVGIMPVYKEEGYWTVPDTKEQQLYLLRYEVSLFASTSERFRQLKTTVLEKLDLPLLRKSPETLKLEVLERYRDLPNPAMYVCETDLDFPYEATILPIAKRKLMAQLSS